jgi:hypothetical protein
MMLCFQEVESSKKEVILLPKLCESEIEIMAIEELVSLG